MCGELPRSTTWKLHNCWSYIVPSLIPACNFAYVRCNMCAALNVYSYSKMRKGTEVVHDQERHAVLTEYTTRFNAWSVCEAKDMPSGSSILSNVYLGFSVSFYVLHHPFGCICWSIPLLDNFKNLFCDLVFFGCFWGANDVKYRIFCSKRCAKHESSSSYIPLQ